jgi:Mn-dependent DtxR family transcriptional regulator
MTMTDSFGQEMKIKSRLEVLRRAHEAKQNNHAKYTYRMQDYLEVIYELVQHKGYATSVDLSEHLNVSGPSVTKMMQRLHASGFAAYEKYRGISLTEKGIDIAKAIHERHGILLEFLKMIGVAEHIANMDAEAIEHYLHPGTLRKLKQLVERRKEDYLKS